MARECIYNNININKILGNGVPPQQTIRNQYNRIIIIIMNANCFGPPSF